MIIQLPEDVRTIIERLSAGGWEAYAVGGCVRDVLLGRTPADWDITTSARPEEVKAVFSHTIDTGIRHGTVTVRLNRHNYEVTTYRIDGKYEDGRHPKDVSFTRSLSEDLKRRDFTINAMAYNDVDGIVDLYGGQADLAAGIIRCVGDPMKRFSEDALRMLRAVRFAAQLSFHVEEETFSAAKRLAPTLSKVSAERIRVELEKILCCDHPQMLSLACDAGLTAVFLPEWDEMMKTPQNTPHHDGTVGEHTLRVIGGVPANPSYLRIAAMLHDIAKPVTRRTDPKGRDHFMGHPETGAIMSGKILRRLKFDNATIRRVCTLIRYHDDRQAVTPPSIRREIAAVGAGLYPQLLLLRHADLMAQSTYQRDEKLAIWERQKTVYEQAIEKGACLSLQDLAVTGDDLIREGIPKGPQIGRILKELFDLVLLEPAGNERENLLSEARRIQRESEGQDGRRR